jgi:uncharacterized protein (DUF2141 family)
MAMLVVTLSIVAAAASAAEVNGRITVKVFGTSS